MEQHWLYRPGSVGKLWRGAWIGLITLLVADLFVHVHGHFGFDEWFGFHAGYGFAGCVALVVIAKGLGMFLKRSDDYYGEGSAKPTPEQDP